eukprot:1191255-Prorocentrum_minimum.AAC.4
MPPPPESEFRLLPWFCETGFDGSANTIACETKQHRQPASERETVLERQLHKRTTRQRTAGG